MSVAPLRDRVLIKKDEAEEKTKGGIFIPDVSKDPPITGIVLKAGPGLISVYGVLIPTTVKAGDRVIFPKFCGVDLQSIEKNLMIVPESEILGVVE